MSAVRFRQDPVGGFGVAEPENPPAFSPLEHADQAAFVRWLRSRGVRFHSVPNGAAESRRRGATLKREGLEAGVPDLVVFPRNSSSPVWLEMKRASGKMGDVRPEQREWLSFLAGYGVGAWVAFGLEAARALIVQLETRGDLTGG